MTTEPCTVMESLAHQTGRLYRFAPTTTLKQARETLEATHPELGKLTIVLTPATGGVKGAGPR